MKSESIFLEIIGVLIVLGGSYGVTQFISITPFDRELSRVQNNAFFSVIPTVVYLVYRTYFGLSFWVSSKVPQQFRHLEWYLSTILVSGGFMGGYYVPTVQPTLSALFDYYAGDIQTVLYTASKPELEKAYVLGLKVAALIGVWFAALFVVELLIRLVMLIVVYLLRTVGILSKPKMGADGDDICVEEKAISEGTHEKFE